MIGSVISRRGRGRVSRRVVGVVSWGWNAVNYDLLVALNASIAILLLVLPIIALLLFLPA